MQPPPLKAEGRQCPRLFQREGREGFNPAPAIGFLTATLFRTKAPLGGVSQRSSAHSGQIAILIHYYVVESDLADYFLFFKGPRHHKKKEFLAISCAASRKSKSSRPLEQYLPQKPIPLQYWWQSFWRRRYKLYEFFFRRLVRNAGLGWPAWSRRTIGTKPWPGRSM